MLVPAGLSEALDGADPSYREAALTLAAERWDAAPAWNTPHVLRLLSFIYYQRVKAHVFSLLKKGLRFFCQKTTANPNKIRNTIFDTLVEN